MAYASYPMTPAPKKPIVPATPAMSTPSPMMTPKPPNFGGALGAVVPSLSGPGPGTGFDAAADSRNKLGLTTEPPKANFGMTPAPNMSTPTGPVYGGPSRPIVSPATATPAVPVVPTTSNGQTINPATGGVSDPNAAANGMNFGAPSGTGVPTQPTPAVPSGPASSNPSPVTSPLAPAAPASPDMSSLESEYKKNLAMTPEEIANQEELDRLQQAYKTGVNKVTDQPIPMEFITGQNASLLRQNLALREPLEARAARLQAQRLAALNASKFSLERADKKEEKAKEAEKPVTLSPGETVGKYDPTTGAYKPSYTAPEKKGDATRGYTTLSPGQRVVDAQGNIIAENPASSAVGKTITVAPGNTVIDPQGNVIYKAPPKAGPSGRAGEALAALSVLETLPGLSSAVGFKGASSFFGLKGKPIEGTPAADFNAKLEQFKSDMTLSMIPYLKGTGAISDAEQRMLSSAATALSTTQSETEFKAEMARIKVVLEAAAAKEESSSQQKSADEANSELELNGIIYVDDGTGNYVPKASGGAGAANIQISSRLGKVNNNPGNLRYAGQAGASQGEGGFARFESPQAGYAALKNQIQLDATRGLTLRQFISKYAPPSENDTELYIRQMMQSTGANENTKIASIDIEKLARAMALKESGTRIA